MLLEWKQQIEDGAAEFGEIEHKSRENEVMGDPVPSDLGTIL